MISEGDLGDFSREITAYNDSATYQDVLVRCIFDDEQNVGSLNGSGTTKPDSYTAIKLIGFDIYFGWTDTRAELIGLP